MKIITGITCCDDCPYINNNFADEDDLEGYIIATCFHPDNHCPTIENSTIIDPNCPLEDITNLLLNKYKEGFNDGWNENN